MSEPRTSTPRSTRALRKTGPGETGVELVVDLPLAEVAAGFAMIRVHAAGICGTDLHIIKDEYASDWPVTMGHEVTGEVVSVGDPSDGYLLGKRISAETFFSTCEACVFCRTGRRNLCASRRSIGTHIDGAFAEHVLLPTRNLHVVPDSVGDHAGALCEPLACICQALLDPPLVSPGDRVLVVGPGTMGLLAAQVAKAQGGVVTVSGLPSDAARLTVARNLGLAISETGAESDTFDVTIECSGSAGGMASALDAVVKGGRLIIIGIFGRPITVDLDVVLFKELRVSSGFASTPGSWTRAVSLLRAGLVRLDPLVGKVTSLEDWRTGLDAAGHATSLKVVIDPRGT